MAHHSEHNHRSKRKPQDIGVENWAPMERQAWIQRCMARMPGPQGDTVLQSHPRAKFRARQQPPLTEPQTIQHFRNLPVSAIPQYNLSQSFPCSPVMMGLGSSCVLFPKLCLALTDLLPLGLLLKYRDLSSLQRWENQRKPRQQKFI